MPAGGAELAVGCGLASGAGEAVVAAGPAAVEPSAPLEMPAAEGPHPFFAAFSSTWRSVNSWQKRSPSGQARVRCLACAGRHRALDVAQLGLYAGLDGPNDRGGQLHAIRNPSSQWKSAPQPTGRS
jgi:hypothetical protein